MLSLLWCMQAAGISTLFQWWTRRGASASDRRGWGASWGLGDSGLISTTLRGARLSSWGGRGDDDSHVEAVNGRRGLSSLWGCYRGEVASSQRRPSEAEEEGSSGSGGGRGKARSNSGTTEEKEPFLGGGSSSGSSVMPVDTYLRSVYVSNRGRVDGTERGPWQSSFLRRNTTREHLPTSASSSSGTGEAASGSNPVGVAARTSPASSSSAAGGAEMSALARAFEKKRLAIVASLRHRTKLSMVLFCPLMVLIMLLATLVSFSRTGVPSGGDALSSVYPAASMVRGAPGRGAERDKYTVMINTYRRHDMAKDAVQHYANCERVDSIRVVWSENGSAPQEASDRQWFSTKKPVFYDKYETTSLNNRFIPPEGLSTDAVFAVDDDIRVPCADLEFAHEVWKVADGSLVGFMPRIHTPDPKGQFFRYNGWWKVWWDGEYSLVLTKAAFLHRDFLKAYSEHMPKDIRDYVDANRNCEDIAMQFLASNLTGKPPIFVRGHLTDLGVFKGISTKSWTKLTHMKSRGQCLNDFVELYGGIMPLVKGRIVAGPASSWWFNQPSTVFDYFSSDMLMGKGSGGAGLPSIRQAKASYIVPPLALGILVILKLLS